MPAANPFRPKRRRPAPLFRLIGARRDFDLPSVKVSQGRKRSRLAIAPSEVSGVGPMSDAGALKPLAMDDEERPMTFCASILGWRLRDRLSTPRVEGDVSSGVF